MRRIKPRVQALTFHAVSPHVMSLFIFGVLMYFLQFWYCLVIHDDGSEFKTFILQPFLGPFHLADVTMYLVLSWVLLLARIIHEIGASRYAMAKPVAYLRSDEEISSSGRLREMKATQEGRRIEAMASKPSGLRSWTERSPLDASRS